MNDDECFKTLGFNVLRAFKCHRQAMLCLVRGRRKFVIVPLVFVHMEYLLMLLSRFELRKEML